MGTMADGTLTYDWWLIDRHGTRWNLFGDLQGERGVTLEKIDNVEASPERSLTGSSHMIGQRVGAGRTYPALRPTLTVSIATDFYVTAYVDWLDAWSQDEGDLCFLYCQSPHTGRIKKMAVSLDASRPAPIGDPHVVGLVVQEMNLLGLDGVWTSDEVALAQGQSWTNPGDIEPILTYWPTGTGSIRLQVDSDAWTATHDVSMAGSYVDLDPDAMMKTFIESDSGWVVSPILWSQWRNQWNPILVGNGKKLDVISAVGAVKATPRFIHPW